MKILLLLVAVLVDSCMLLWPLFVHGELPLETFCLMMCVVCAGGIALRAYPLWALYQACFYLFSSVSLWYMNYRDFVISLLR
jgi:hypothetical protein